MIKTVLQLFWEFFKIGLFAVGGGPATLPYLMELTKTHDWYTMEELTDMIAVSESTPGPLGLNMATYAGYKTVGLFGGVVSTLGLALPSIIIIVLIAKFLENFSENFYVKGAFKGIRPTIAAIIAASVYQVCRVSLFAVTETALIPQIGPIILCIIIFILLQFKKFSKIHPALWFLGAMILGVVLKL